MAGEVIEINPCSDDLNKAELFALLESNSDVNFFCPNTAYTSSNGKKYKLKHPLLKRTRYIDGLNHPQIKYDVLSEQSIATGCFGVAFDVIKTITLGKNSLWLKDDNNHIVKMSVEELLKSGNKTIQPTDPWEVTQEHRFLKMGDRFHPKQIQHQKNSPSLNFMTTRKFKGKTLFKILNPDDQNDVLDVEKRLRLSIALLRAFKNQILELDLIHRDIKPENIIVDMDTMEVNFIDLGLSTEEKNNDRRHCGTPLYAAPEILLDLQYGKEIDIFSLGRVLSEIWDDNSATWYVPVTNEYEYVKAFSTSNLFERKNKNLYTNMEKEAKDKVIESIDNMIEVDPDERKKNNIDNLIYQFHRAYIAQCYGKADSLALSNSFKQGLDARDELIRSNKMDDFYDKLEKTLSKIDDNENSIKEFTHGLGFPSLKKATNKLEVMSFPRELIDRFDGEIRKYNDLFTQAADFFNQYKIISNTDIFSDLKEFLLELRHKANIINKRPFDLDLLQRTSEAMATRYDYWNNRFKKIEKRIVKDEDFKKIRGNIDALGNKRILVINENNINHFLINLKNLLRNALRKYMQETLTEKNITNKDRAASARRQQDITDFRTIIDTNNNIASLKTAVKERMYSKKFETGIFGYSKLRSRLKKALEKHEVQARSTTHELRKL